MTSNEILLVLFVIGPAVWRLSSLLAFEDGPRDIFEKLRGVGPDVFKAAIVCQWCNSIYLGVAYSLAFLYSPKLAAALALPFTLSALAVFYQGVLGRFYT